MLRGLWVLLKPFALTGSPWYHDSRRKGAAFATSPGVRHHCPLLQACIGTWQPLSKCAIWVSEEWAIQLIRRAPRIKLKCQVKLEVQFYQSASCDTLQRGQAELLAAASAEWGPRPEWQQLSAQAPEPQRHPHLKSQHWHTKKEEKVQSCTVVVRHNLLKKTEI